jgi:NADH-quinone oxidoreductase subunit L
MTDPALLALTALLLSAAAVEAWCRTAPADFHLRAYEWIPVESGALATVGVLADADSTLMLILVAGVAFLVQLYSFGYVAGEPPGSLGRYSADRRSSPSG